MDLPFSGFELTFIIIAFVIFSLFSLASVCIQPQAANSGTQSSATVRQAQTKYQFLNAAYCVSAQF